MSDTSEKSGSISNLPDFNTILLGLPDDDLRDRGIDPDKFRAGEADYNLKGFVAPESPADPNQGYTYVAPPDGQNELGVLTITDASKIVGSPADMSKFCGGQPFMFVEFEGIGFRVYGNADHLSKAMQTNEKLRALPIDSENLRKLKAHLTPKAPAETESHPSEPRL